MNEWLEAARFVRAALERLAAAGLAEQVGDDWRSTDRIPTDSRALGSLVRFGYAEVGDWLSALDRAGFSVGQVDRWAALVSLELLARHGGPSLGRAVGALVTLGALEAPERAAILGRYRRHIGRLEDTDRLETLADALDAEYRAALDWLEAAGEVSVDDYGRWSWVQYMPPAGLDRLTAALRRAAELEALEQAEAEQAELDAVEALGWLDDR